MVNRKYLAMLDHKSVIRELSEYANARGKEIGYENVFDYSLGNPSVPAPDSYRDISVKLLQEEAPLTLHGYNLYNRKQLLQSKNTKAKKL